MKILQCKNQIRLHNMVDLETVKLTSYTAVSVAAVHYGLMTLFPLVNEIICQIKEEQSWHLLTFLLSCLYEKQLKLPIKMEYAWQTKL